MPETEVTPPKPTKEEIRAAAGKTVPDIVASGLRILFCGINPGLYSGAAGHHFARPGNRFWPALHKSGITDRQLSPYEEREMLRFHCGITNIVNRATAAASELSSDELMVGARRLERKVRRYLPAYFAVLGITAYRTAFERPDAVLGPQEGQIGLSRVWVLPNPSGLNAHFQLAELARLFRDLRDAAMPKIRG